MNDNRRVDELLIRGGDFLSRIRDLESSLAAVTAERDKWKYAVGESYRIKEVYRLEVDRLTSQLEKAEEALNLVLECCTTRGHPRFPLEVTREYFAGKGKGEK